LGLLSDFLQFFKEFAGLDIAERQAVRSVSHEFGGYYYNAMFGASKNFYLLFTFLWREFVTMNCLVDFKKISDDVNKINNIDEVGLE
jgi:hypothetical protein